MSRLITLAVYVAAYLAGRRHGFEDARVSAMRGLFPRISRHDAIQVHREIERGRR